MCVVDMQHNGTANPNIDVMIQSGTFTTTANEFMNLDNRSRFKVIFDRHHVVYPVNDWAAGGATANSVSNALESMHQEILKKVNFPVTFGSVSTPATSDIQTGAILLFAWATTGGFQVYCTTRVRYTDA